MNLTAGVFCQHASILVMLLCTVPCFPNNLLFTAYDKVMVKRVHLITDFCSDLWALWFHGIKGFHGITCEKVKNNMTFWCFELWDLFLLSLIDNKKSRFYKWIYIEEKKLKIKQIRRYIQNDWKYCLLSFKLDSHV